GLFKDGPVVLTVTGRTSGQPRSTPITPFEVDGQRYVVGGLPGPDWVRNAQAHPEAVLVRGKTREPVRMVELPVEQARPLLRQFPV
ncbi:deazaflavin-dependent nitroreductase, partial [Mycobacterium sp. ITM-2017-0098]